MSFATGNICITKRGLLVVEELRSGDEVLGIDRNRNSCFGKIIEIGEATKTAAFLIIGSSGEAVVQQDQTLPIISGRLTAYELACKADRRLLKLERLPPIGAYSDADCTQSGCVARLFSFIQKDIILKEIRLRNSRSLSFQTTAELRLRNGVLRAFETYVSPLSTRYTKSALLHSGDCRGFELLDAFTVDRRIAVQITAARQAWQFYARSAQLVPLITATPAYGCMYVTMDKSSSRRFDRVEAVDFLGERSFHALKFDSSNFHPVIGSLPIY